MGKEVLITTNHYKADFNSKQLLYQYDVSLEGFEKTALVSSRTRGTRERQQQQRKPKSIEKVIIKDLRQRKKQQQTKEARRAV